jgi:uncharacterized protein (TIGR02246 family)
MKKNWGFIAVLGMLAVLTAGIIFAQPKTPTAEPTARPDDEKSVRDASEALARAFEKGDATAVAGFFTEEGEYMDEDRDPVRGREALAKAYTDFFSKRPEVKVESKSDKVRFLGKDTALQEGTFSVKAKDTPANSTRYSTLYVRQDGKWLIAMLKEWGDETTNKANLEDLAWMIGSWESANGESRARTKYEWAEGKKFIRVQYSVELSEKGKKSTSTGTQVIGVDPASGLIHAWTFDSEGGVGESNWTWDGERWAIDSNGSLPDGSDTTAMNFLTPSGNDAFTWRSVKRTVTGESLPDLAPVKVKRVKE